MQTPNLNPDRLGKWSISCELIASEAESRGYTVNVIHAGKNLFTMSGDGKTFLSKNVDCGINTSLGFRMSKFKDATYLILKKSGVRIPDTKYAFRKNLEDVQGFLHKYNLEFPLVTKPVDGTHGDGVAVGLDSIEEFTQGLEYTFKTGTSKAIVQEQIVGDDHRIIVVGGKLVAAALRYPPSVVGNGTNTIKELIEEENTNPLRGKGNHTTPLSQIKIDGVAENFLQENGLSLDTILENGKKVYVRENANLSTGGISIDVTDKVHPSVIENCEKAARVMQMRLCAIDFMCTDISKDLAETRGAIIEINHTPGLRMHHFPSQGQSRDVAGAIVDELFRM